MRNLAKKRARYFSFSVAALLAIMATLSTAGASEENYSLLKLPKLKRVNPTKLTELTTYKEFAPGIQVQIGQAVALTGTIIIDQGPVDGLEVLACLATGKTHESLVRLDAANGQLVKAACLAALGLSDGVPAEEGRSIPARGMPVRVLIEWEPLDQPGTWYSIDASCLIRDRITDQNYPALPFIFTGSRFLVIDETAPDGRPVKQERFMLDNTKSVINIVDEPDSLLASPSPGAGFDKHFEVNSGICPPANSKARIIIQKIVMPVTLAMDAGGVLLFNGQPLNDNDLGALLVKHFGPGTTPLVNALAISVEAETESAHDVAARDRIMSAAAKAQVWVVPVFSLTAKAP